MSTPQVLTVDPADNPAPAPSLKARYADWPAPAPSLKARYADWPQPGDERDQPWDHSALGIGPSAIDELRDNAGSPNTLSPIVIGHSMPILTSGAGGDQAYAVNELARRLKKLGFETSISQGRNAFSILDQSVMTAVEHFRETYGVEEDPTAWGGNTRAARDRANAHVGPWTWEALIRASDRAD